MKRAAPKVRNVLLDETFLNALLATDAPEHGDACAMYNELVGNYENGRDRLFALSTVLGDLPREFRRNALAPVETVHVAKQHRSAASAMASSLGIPWMALSLVMMRRERITAVATATHAFDAFEVEVLSVAPLGAAPAAFEPPAFDPPGADQVPAADAVSSETAPPPAPRSTGE